MPAACRGGREARRAGWRPQGLTRRRRPCKTLLSCLKEVSFAMAHSLHASSPAAVRSNRPDLATDAIRTAREDLAACFRMAARNGFEEGICNHFSAVVPGHDDLFLVNPYGYAFRELTASKLLICDFEGNVIDGRGKPEATAFYIHARIHKLVPRAK